MFAPLPFSNLSPWSRICLATLAGALLWTWPATDRAEDILPDAARTNGQDTLSSIATLRAKASPSLVTLGSDKDHEALCATVVDAKGYLLTKASEAAALSPLKVYLPDGAALTPRVVHRDDHMDLLLLKVDRDLPAITWGDSRSLSAAQWLCSPTLGGKDWRLGVFSAKRRAVPSSGAVIGIRMGHDEVGTSGILIEHVSEESPAEEAGIKDRDVLIAINGRSVATVAAVKGILSQLHPGDMVKLRYSREGKESEVDVHLASRRRVEMAPEDFANHGTSTRTDDFPEVLQHDMPLSPTDMGSPIYDLQGFAMGLNIARVDRVTNFALPAEVFWPKVRLWIAQDQGPKNNAPPAPATANAR